EADEMWRGQSKEEHERAEQRRAQLRASNKRSQVILGAVAGSLGLVTLTALIDGDLAHKAREKQLNEQLQLLADALVQQPLNVSSIQTMSGQVIDFKNPTLEGQTVIDHLITNGHTGPGNTNDKGRALDPWLGEHIQINISTAAGNPFCSFPLDTRKFKQ